MTSLDHRLIAYRQLAGAGLEIGALHEPAPVPAAARVRYFDAISEARAAQLFPEIDPARFVHVDVVGDLDRDGLAQFRDGEFDFLVINHVLEHLANPVKSIREVFRVVRPGGLLVIAIPDKRFTFDREREETSIEHLWGDYENNTLESDDAHYIDFLRSAAKHVFLEAPEHLPNHVKRCRERREHSHVWTSDSFKRFLEVILPRLGVRAQCVFESKGEENNIEYFSLWRKLG